MLVVLLGSPATARGAQGDSHTKARKSGSLTGNQELPELKTPWEAWSRGVPNENPTYRGAASLAGSCPTQLNSFCFFTFLKICSFPPFSSKPVKLCILRNKRPGAALSHALPVFMVYQLHLSEDKHNLFGFHLLISFEAS